METQQQEEEGAVAVVGACSSGGSVSTVEEEEEVEEESNMGNSYPCEADLELGLGLPHVGGGCGGGGGGGGGLKGLWFSRVLRGLGAAGSMNDCASSSSSNDDDRIVNVNGKVSAGTKRAADSVTSAGIGGGGVGQVVGWPPIRSYRMNSLANQTKSVVTGELNSTSDNSKGKGIVYSPGDNINGGSIGRGHLKSSLFVKVTMDGIGIGRKVDLSAHSCYESMALALEDMFIVPGRTLDVSKSNGEVRAAVRRGIRVPKLLGGSSDYVLTYEDKDGDWMLVGDVPWGMFLSTVKRLRIMKTCEAKGLAPIFEDQSGKQRSRPI